MKFIYLKKKKMPLGLILITISAGWILNGGHLKIVLSCVLQQMKFLQLEPVHLQHHLLYHKQHNQQRQSLLQM